MLLDFAVAIQYLASSFLLLPGSSESTATFGHVEFRANQQQNSEMIFNQPHLQLSIFEPSSGMRHFIESLYKPILNEFWIGQF